MSFVEGLLMVVVTSFIAFYLGSLNAFVVITMSVFVVVNERLPFNMYAMAGYMFGVTFWTVMTLLTPLKLTH